MTRNATFSADIAVGRGPMACYYYRGLEAQWGLFPFDHMATSGETPNM